MSNWCPISLLNTDLKIASAAIANRFKQVLGGIISDTQKGFMKDRFMGENTRLLYDLMHYLEENDMDGLLLLVLYLVNWLDASCSYIAYLYSP
jgi:hypothetical protein